MRIELEPEEKDPVLVMMGMFNSDKPLIDGIPVSQDPDLYLVAEMMGAEAEGLHAWEIAPSRYPRPSFTRAAGGFPA